MRSSVLVVLPLAAVIALGCGRSEPRQPGKLDTAAARAGERQVVLRVDGMV